HFVFNGSLYKQVEGMAMGSPLGPTFANIFMCHLEQEYLSQCPNAFKPSFYKRYVDDTFALFNDEHQANLFLDYVNTIHQNIKFTLDVENNGKISFLDILISRANGRFETGVFRKGTFTGLGLNFFSYCPLTSSSIHVEHFYIEPSACVLLGQNFMKK
ncbi:MAG: reverse transcriptase domain-containing protein, partial [Cyanobacteria bacterium J06614_10]